MDAVKFIEGRNRMCKYYAKNCYFCPLFNFDCNNVGNMEENGKMEKIVEIVEEWSRKNPKKTMLQDFLEKYPKAPLNDDGTPHACPWGLGYTNDEYCLISEDCKQCWDRPLEE